MLDLSKPIQTRSGRKVRILATDLKSDYPIAFSVTNAVGEELVTTCRPDGSTHGWGEHEDDLVNVPAETPFGDKPETKMAIDMIRKLVPRHYLVEISSAAYGDIKDGVNQDRLKTLREIYYVTRQAMLEKSDA